MPHHMSHLVTARLRVATTAALAAITLLFTVTAQAEVRTNAIRLTGTANSLQLTSGFSTASPPVSPWDPSISFSFKVAKPTGLRGLLKFERQLSLLTYTLAGDGDVYVAKKGQLLNDSTLRSNKLVLLTDAVKKPAVWVGREFWLAVGLKPFTQAGYLPETPYAQFAWAYVRFTQAGVPQLLSSANTVDEPGLVVGSTESCSPCTTP